MGSHRKNKTPSSVAEKRWSSSSSTKDDSLFDLNGSSNGSLDYEPQSLPIKEPNQRHYYSRYEYDDDDSTARTLDFSKVLQDVEGSLVGTMTSSVVAISGLWSSSPSSSSGSFHVTWKEMMYLVFAIVLLAGLCKLEAQSRRSLNIYFLVFIDSLTFLGRCWFVVAKDAFFI